jgi:hypothetical protein
MITTPLLDEKNKAQRKLAAQAHHDVSEYLALSHSIVAAVSSKYGYRFKYGSLRGGEIELEQRIEPNDGRAGSSVSGSSQQAEGSAGHLG